MKRNFGDLRINATNANDKRLISDSISFQHFSQLDVSN